MRRVDRNEDKLNYQLDIGARRFCAPRFRFRCKEYGVVGAICINIDINVIRDEVLKSADAAAEFFRNYCRTDMKLDENILSKDEYRLALAGSGTFASKA